MLLAAFFSAAVVELPGKPHASLPLIYFTSTDDPDSKPSSWCRVRAPSIEVSHNLEATKADVMLNLTIAVFLTQASLYPLHQEPHLNLKRLGHRQETKPNPMSAQSQAA